MPDLSTPSFSSQSPAPLSSIEKADENASWIWVSLAVEVSFVVAMFSVLSKAGLSFNDAAVYLPLLFALISVVIYLFGLTFARKSLEGYRTEAENLESAAVSLRHCAEAAQPEGGVGALLTEGGRREIKALYECASHENALGKSAVPLLHFHLWELLGAIMRGAPLLTGDGAYADDKHFPRPERVARAMMDIVLNVGIAGTFLSLIITFTRPINDTGAGGIGETLLSHLGPGLVSGMAAVVANIALRLCHTSLVTAQDELTHKVQACLNENLLINLPRGLTSSDDRFAEQVAFQIRTHSEQSGWLMEQQLAGMAERLHESNLQIAELFALKLEPSIKLIATETDSLARSADKLVEVSSSWSQLDMALKETHQQFLSDHTTGLDRHKKQVDALFEAYARSLRDLLSGLEKHQNKAIAATEAHFQALETRQATRLESFVAVATERTSDAVASRIAGIDVAFSQTLTRLQSDLSDALPDAIGRHVAVAMTETVDNMEKLRSDITAVTEAVLHLQKASAETVARQEKRTTLADDKHSLFVARVEETQKQLAGIIEQGQKLQIEGLSVWQQNAQNCLGQIESAYGLAAEGIKEGSGKLASSLQSLVTSVDNATSPIDGLSRRLRSTQQAVDTLEKSVQTLRDLETQVGSGLIGFGDKTDGLKDVLTTTTLRLSRLSDVLEDAISTAITSSEVVFSKGEAEPATILSEGEKDKDVSLHNLDAAR